MTDRFPDPLAIFPLTGAVLLPGVRMPLNIFEPRYLAMVRDVLAAEKMIGMIQPLARAKSEGEPTLYDIGCVGEIVEDQTTEDGRILINLQGRQRFRILSEISVATPYRQVRADFAEFATDGDEQDTDSHQVPLRLAIERFLDAKSISFDWGRIEGMGTANLVNLVMMLLPFGPAEKQALLEAIDLAARVDTAIALIDMLAADTSGSQNNQLQ